MSANLNQSTLQSTRKSTWTAGGQSTVHPPLRGGRGRIVRQMDTSETSAGNGSFSTVTLTLKPVSGGNWQRPPEQRLKALLKAALRCFGFRCKSLTTTGLRQHLKDPPQSGDETLPEVPMNFL